MDRRRAAGLLAPGQAPRLPVVGSPIIQIDQAWTFSMRYQANGQRTTTQAQAQAALTDLGNVGTGQDFGVSSAMFGTFAEELTRPEALWDPVLASSWRPRRRSWPAYPAWTGA